MGFHLKRFFWLILSISIILPGFPLKEAVAQQGVSEDVPKVGMTPRLLRKPERVLDEEQCSALLNRINFLRSPQHRQKLQNGMDSVDKLLDQAREGKQEADAKLRKVLKEEAKGFLKNLALDKLAVGKYRKSIQLLQKEGKTGAAKFLLPLKKLEKALGDSHLALQAVIDAQGAQTDYFLKQVSNARKTSQAAQGAHQSLLDEMVLSDLPKDLGEILSSVAPGFPAILFKLGHLGIQVTAASLDKYWSGQNLSTLKKHSGRMHYQLRAMDLNLDSGQYRYRKYCKVKVPPTEQAKSQISEPPPPLTPAAPTEVAASEAPGSGIALPLLGGIVGLGAAGGAVALAAGGLGGGGGDGGGAASASDSCDACCRETDGSWCEAAFGNACCPAGFPHFYPDGRCYETISDIDGDGALDFNFTLCGCEVTP